MSDHETYQVFLWIKGSSQPIHYNATGVYIKPAYIGITFWRDGNKIIHKYPTRDVFRIEEEYKYLARESERVTGETS